ncbi:hypothetical protein BDV93DRAFT_607213 [Ceratobasidium sp. AG-I]|nr:hypothetical protein BDV93DRAFT_607213 [Ceratobasidium sp. AG-I]
MKRLSLLWLCAFASYGSTPAVAQPSQNNLAQLDDTYTYSVTLETGIQYSPGWLQFTGDQAQERHGSSISTTNVDGASLVLFFRGRSISYIGDTSPNSANTRISIDGSGLQLANDIGPLTYQQALWTGTDLVEDDHQIIITRDISNSDWWTTLDYLQVSNPEDWRPLSMGPGAAKIPKGALLIDDSDSHISYQGSWSVTNSTAQSFFFGGHKHTTTTHGDSLTLSFIGTAVWYFVDKRAQNGRVMISVDGSEGVQVNTSLPDSDDRWFSQVLCWEKTGLSDGEHKVTITHADTPGKPVSLDFFKYLPSTTPSSSKFPKGAIIGVAAGGGALLFVVLATSIYCVRRSRRSRATRNDNQITNDDSTDVVMDQYATLASPLVTPGPRASNMNEPRVPNNATDTTPQLMMEEEVHANQGWPHQMSYTGLPEL